jgi:hypothetical protein
LEIGNQAFTHIIFYTISIKQFGGSVYRFRTIHILYNSHYNIIVVTVSILNVFTIAALYTSGLYINIIYSYVVCAVDKNISLYTLYFSGNPPRSRCNNVNKAKSPENKTFYPCIYNRFILLLFACIFVQYISFSFTAWFIVAGYNRTFVCEHVPILYNIITSARVGIRVIV